MPRFIMAPLAAQSPTGAATAMLAHKLKLKAMEMRGCLPWWT